MMQRSLTDAAQQLIISRSSVRAQLPALIVISAISIWYVRGLLSSVNRKLLAEPLLEFQSSSYPRVTGGKPNSRIERAGAINRQNE